MYDRIKSWGMYDRIKSRGISYIRFNYIILGECMIELNLGEL